MRVFIGYDTRETVSYHVLAHSILRRSSIPVSIQPVMLSQLGDLYRRGRGPMETTEFSLSRFMVPCLSRYEGWSVFMDCDMLCQIDLAQLLPIIEANMDKAVLVCKHDYVPKDVLKHLGHAQTAYPHKNWSSFMVMNNARCAELTPDYVSNASALSLHRFNWLDDAAIGSLDLDWNWLVGEYVQHEEAKMLHYTRGGPWFQATAHCDHADLWRAEFKHMLGEL